MGFEWVFYCVRVEWVVVGMGVRVVDCMCLCGGMVVVGVVGHGKMSLKGTLNTWVGIGVAWTLNNSR